MKRVDSSLVKVFVCSLPVVLLCGLFSYLYNTGMVDRTTDVAQFCNAFAGFVYAAWMTLCIVFSIRLMVSGPFRDQLLSRVTFVQERDEREVMLTGKATKTTFLTTLAILLFLFCLSCFQVSVYRVPPEKALDGKTGVVSLGLNFKLLESTKQVGADADELRNQDIFTYSGLPVSSTAIILGLLLWQVCSYNATMRRLTRRF